MESNVKNEINAQMDFFKDIASDLVMLKQIVRDINSEIKNNIDIMKQTDVQSEFIKSLNDNVELRHRKENVEKDIDLNKKIFRQTFEAYSDFCDCKINDCREKMDVNSNSEREKVIREYDLWCNHRSNLEDYYSDVCRDLFGKNALENGAEFESEK